jgi:hypothetical protein
MGPNWYDRAVEQLEEQYAAGLISYEEFRAEMRELNAERARDAYDDYMGGGW